MIVFTFSFHTLTYVSIFQSSVITPFFLDFFLDQKISKMTEPTPQQSIDHRPMTPASLTFKDLSTLHNEYTQQAYNHFQQHQEKVNKMINNIKNINSSESSLANLTKGNGAGTAGSGPKLLKITDLIPESAEISDYHYTKLEEIIQERNLKIIKAENIKKIKNEKAEILSTNKINLLKDFASDEKLLEAWKLESNLVYQNLISKYRVVLD